MNSPTEIVFINIKTQSKTEGRKISCKISVPIRKEHGP
jgi:hypothetical protein